MIVLGGIRDKFVMRNCWSMIKWRLAAWMKLTRIKHDRLYWHPLPYGTVGQQELMGR